MVRCIRWKSLLRAACAIFATLPAGCAKYATITAVPLSPQNQCEPEGIPYYLPKPLLVVAKNIRHIDESKVGLTNPVPIPNGYDNQATYADVKANVTVPGEQSAAAASIPAAAPGGTFDASEAELPDISEKLTPSGRLADGVEPDSFFTYQIVFVPDLTQKYGLRIKGGPGEIRAAMNLVNGWMYTGMGPFYLKDSSTAQNLMAFGVGSMFAGRGVADVLDEVNDLARIAAGPGLGEEERGRLDGDDELLGKLNRIADLAARQKKVPERMLNYAEIYIYEPTLVGGRTHWELVAQHNFDRHYFRAEIDPENMRMLLEQALSSGGSPERGAGGSIESGPGHGTGGSPGIPERGAGEGEATTGGHRPNGAASAIPRPDAFDERFDRVEEQILGTVRDASSELPNTQINVNVHNNAETPRGAGARERPRHHVLQRLFGAKEPKSVRSVVTRYANQQPADASTSSPGATQSN